MISKSAHNAGALSSLKLLLVAEYYHSGGTRTYVTHLLNFYAAHGADVTLVTTLPYVDIEMQAIVDSLGYRLMTFAEVMGEMGSGREHRRPTVWSWAEFRRERTAFRLLARRLGIDRVVVSSGNPGMLLSAAWATPNPLFVAHGYPHGRRQEVFARHYLSRLIPRGTKFVAVSEFQAQIMQDMWRTEQRDCTVHTVLSSYGPLSSNVSPQPPPWTILTASLVEQYKEPFDWIDVADRVIGRLPEGSVEFTWFGDGSLLEQARAEAAAKSGAAHIHFPGYIRDPSEEYTTARVYLQLSSIENMSLAVIDAQRHGLPCVVTDAGGLPEIVDHGLNGLVVPVGDVEAAADSVCALLANTHLWERMSSESQRTYQKRHSYASWESVMLRLHCVSQ
jgi:glycosyltransferase involved in cell wall biosynthesis